MGDLYLPWPYAAKAIIQHEFDVDHLNIWITFRFAMDQTVRPADEKWLVEADEIPMAVSASTWLDAWTLLLTVPGVEANPDRITLAYGYSLSNGDYVYEGPDENLRITWRKQWEPWGPILSLDVSS